MRIEPLRRSSISFTRFCVMWIAPWVSPTVRLTIRKLIVDPPVVERQCTGSLVVRNVGPSYPHRAYVVMPYYVLHIYDAAGKIIQRSRRTPAG